LTEVVVNGLDDVSLVPREGHGVSGSRRRRALRRRRSARRGRV